MSERIYYRINGWDKHFENAKSRDIGHKSWGVYPLKQGSGYCRMMTKKNGASIYGAFIAMCAIIHQKPKETRQGYLTDTGGIPGYSYDETDIAAMTRINLAIIKAALEELILIHWITPCDPTGKPIEGYHGDTEGIPRDPCTDNTDSTDSIDNTDKKKHVRFQIPTNQEVQTYINEKGYWVNPEEFIAHYESNGWMVGKNKMKSWKAAVTTWHTRSGKTAKTKKKLAGFDITVRFSDKRQPEQYHMKNDTELTETIKRMMLAVIEGQDREYYMDVEAWKRINPSPPQEREYVVDVDFDEEAGK